MYKRFKWNPEILYDDSVFDGLAKLSPSKIFVGSTMELFGPWVREDSLRNIINETTWFPQHTFIFLTKQPQNLPRWSPFPENSWVGVSATNAKMAEEAGFWLWEVKAKVKFVSFEPLLEQIPVHFADYISSDDVQGISWLIIGSQTQPVRHPPKIWVNEIITAADKAKIPIFVKEPLASHLGIYRQDFPK
jgi:protein gp37